MAYEFGSGKRLDLTLPFSAFPISCALWVYPTVTASDTTVLRLASNLSANFEDYNFRDPSRSNQIGINTPSDANRVLTSASFTNNAWNHMTGVSVSASDHRVYLNGGNKGTSVANFAQTPYPLFRIANTSNTVRLAEVAVWNGTLTDDDAAALALGISPLLIQPQNLRFYAPLIRTIQDLFGAAITTTGSPSVYDHPRMIYPVGMQSLWAPAPTNVNVSAVNTAVASQYGGLTEIQVSAANTATASNRSYPPFVEVSAASAAEASQTPNPWQHLISRASASHSAFPPEVVRALTSRGIGLQSVRAITGNLASGRYRR